VEESRATIDVPTLEASLDDLFDASWWLAASYDGWLTSVVTFDGGYAAICEPPSDEGWGDWPETGDVWLSSDGVAWDEAPTQPPARLSGLSSDGETLFAGTESEDGSWGIWASPTGGSWRPVLTADLDWGWWWGPGGVVAGPAGAVVFGVDRDGLVVSWTWDGDRFVPADLGMLATLSPDSASFNVTALDEGFLLSVHDHETDSGSETPMIVSFSSTGASWSDPEPPPPDSPLSWPRPHVIEAVSVGDMNLVAMDAGYGLWATDDGSSWSEIVLEPDGHRSPDVAGGGLGWIVSFAEEPWYSPDAVWYSPDAVSWAELDDLGPLTGESTLIVGSDHLLAFTRVGPETAVSTEVWRLEIDPQALSLATTTTTAIEPGGWNPILAETRAHQAPPAAVCPPGSDPDLPGPSDQQQPDARRTRDICESCEGWSNWEPWWYDPYREPPFATQTAAFDRHAGRIVHLDAVGETWTFDVCTNTWHEMNPTGALSEIKGDLVYDTDSDVTVALGVLVSVYDANSNTCNQPYPHLVDGRVLVEPHGAVYDPLSGLILTVTRPTTTRPDDHWTLWAYDVDTDTWTMVGPVLFERTTPCCTGIDLLGYLPEIDRLIFTTHNEFPTGSVRIEPTTLLLDPRTGEITTIPTDTPVVNPAIPPIRRHGQADNTVYVTNPDGLICGFNSATTTWTTCFAGPEPSRHIAFEALIDDPINNRLVLINGIPPDVLINGIPDAWWIEDAYDTGVWAIDLDTGASLELVPPTPNP
jgi:hypothetical protein